MSALRAHPLDPLIDRPGDLPAPARRPLRVIEGTPAEKRNTTLHGGVFKILAALNFAILGVFWWTFRGDAEALFMVAISAVYLTAYLGTPYAMSRVARVDEPADKPFHQFLEEPFETWTGIITGREALLQVILIPAAVLVAVAGMSIIIGINQ